MNIRLLMQGVGEWEDALFVDGRICDSIFDEYPELQQFQGKVQFTKSGCYKGADGTVKSKICFPDRATALEFKKVWNSLAEQNRLLKPQRSVYWCALCNGYHTSTKVFTTEQSVMQSNHRRYLANLQESYRRYMEEQKEKPHK